MLSLFPRTLLTPTLLLISISISVMTLLLTLALLLLVALLTLLLPLLTLRAWIWIGLAYMAFVFVLCTQLAALGLHFMAPPAKRVVVHSSADVQAARVAAHQAKLAAEAFLRRQSESKRASGEVRAHRDVCGSRAAAAAAAAATAAAAGAAAPRCCSCCCCRGGSRRGLPWPPQPFVCAARGQLECNRRGQLVGGQYGAAPRIGVGAG